MRIVVLSHTIGDAKRMWHYHLAKKYKGYEGRVLFSENLARNLDGLDRSRLIIILCGGYYAVRREENLHLYYYQKEGAIIIDEN